MKLNLAFHNGKIRDRLIESQKHRSSHWRCSATGEISQNSQESKFTRVIQSLLIKLQASAWQLYLKKTLAQVFSCEFCEISKNPFLHRTPLVAASDFYSEALHLFTIPSS